MAAKKTSEIIIPVLTAIIPLGVAYIEHSGKATAEHNTQILIQQQNEIIKNYEAKEKEHNEESKRYLNMLATYDSLLQSE